MRNSLVLQAAVALALLPHLIAQPLWLGSGLAAILLLQAMLRHRRTTPLPRWMAALLAIGLAALVFRAHHTLIGRDGGMALLASLMVAKLFEYRDQRDEVVLIMLGYFSTMVFFLHSQSPGMALLAIASCMLLTLASLQTEQISANLMSQSKLAMRLLLQALPFALVLFLLFPRLPGPLWQMPGENIARSGLSGEALEPGRVSQLALDESVAFRVEFSGRPPAQHLLYWRGPVFEWFDGKRWLPAPRSGVTIPPITPLGSQVDYTLTLEAHQQRWLLALDLPTAWPAEAAMSSRLQVLAPRPITQRYRYAMRSTLDWRIDTDPVRSVSVPLPVQGNPRTRLLAADWSHLTPGERVDAGLAFLRDGGFAYTLEPPLLSSENVIDEFLFDSKLGFCEHFASSFAFLMRAAGVPARVVTGYQGGSWNEAGNYLIVRQADAHAWVEVWLEGKGWTRVDPTAIIAPQRISSGLSASIPQGDTLPLMLRQESSWLKSLRLSLDVAVNGWNQWVIGYNAQRQADLLGRLGISGLSSARHLAWTLALLALVLGLLACGILLSRRKKPQDIAKRHYDAFCRKLSRHGIAIALQEGPENFAQRASAIRPDLAKDIQSITKLYIAARYGSQMGLARDLGRQVRRFRVRPGNPKK